ncbi:MAG: hypothetical protein HN403_18410 [Rhodospirillales bacterium]|jgi:uncharacterized protein YjgD (DUF1641 family)|nr:hypothetical protein [Rhodospirillales bacterium]
MSEIEQLARAAQDALTDGMVERLAVTSANALEVVDRLNEPETKESILYLMDRVTEMHRLGALDTMFDLLSLAHAARSAATDNMVERLFIFVEHMVNNLATEEIATGAHNARRAMEDAAAEVAANPVKGGLGAAYAMLTKPENMQALQFLIATGTNMQKRTAALRGSPELEG